LTKLDTEYKLKNVIKRKRENTKGGVI